MPCDIDVQLKTIKGVLQVSDHDKILSNYGEIVMDPLPDLPVFDEIEVEHGKKIHDYVSIVKVAGSDYCLKRIRWMASDSFQIELSKLLEIGSHPSVMSLCGVMKRHHNKVLGFLMPLVAGTRLDEIMSLPNGKHEQWKEKISATI